MTMERVEQLLDQLESGNATVLDTVVALQAIREEASTVDATIKAFFDEYSAEIATSIKELGGSYKGYTIEERQGGHGWDYSQVDDIKKWEAMLRKEKALLQKLALAAMDAPSKKPTDDYGNIIQLPSYKPRKGHLRITKTN